MTPDLGVPGSRLLPNMLRPLRACDTRYSHPTKVSRSFHEDFPKKGIFRRAARLRSRLGGFLFGFAIGRQARSPPNSRAWRPPIPIAGLSRARASPSCRGGVALSAGAGGCGCFHEGPATAVVILHPALRMNTRDRGHRDWYQLERWRRIARRQRRIEPLCRMCAANGLAVPATVADHIEPHHGDWNSFLTGALQSLCDACHNSRKRFEEIRGYHNEIGDDGWPIDPRHPANREGAP